MKVTMTRHALQGVLAQAVAVTPGRSTLPILGHVLIEADEAVTVSATDLDRSIVVRGSADVASPGRVCVPGKALAELVKTLGDKPVSLERGGDRLVVRSGRAKVQLPIADADDFPALPTVEMDGAVEIGASELSDIIQRSAFAVSTEESRPILNGALFQANGGRLRVVATNGHRLAAVYGPEMPGEWSDVILPATTLATVERSVRGMTGTVTVGVNDNHMAIVTEGATVYTRLIEGPYPNYEQVIPKGCETEATVDRAALLATVRRAMVVASEHTSRVRFDWAEGVVIVSVTTADAGEFEEVIEARVNGPELAIAFNGAYLVEILGRTSADEVTIQMTTATRAATILPVGDPDTLYLCMPLLIFD